MVTCRISAAYAPQALPPSLKVRRTAEALAEAGRRASPKLDRRSGERSRDFRFQMWIAATLLVLLQSVGARAETIDRVLAVVGGQLITLTDVTAARDLGLQTADGAPDPIGSILSKLIERELVLAEVDRYAPPEPAADAVDREVARVRSRFPSPRDLDAALERSGIDERHLRETLRQDLRAAAYLTQRFPAAEDRRRAAIAEWMTSLRRRGDVIDLYLAGR
jgi:hypothetical protein